MYVPWQWLENYEIPKFQLIRRLPSNGCSRPELYVKPRRLRSCGSRFRYSIPSQRCSDWLPACRRSSDRRHRLRLAWFQAHRPLGSRSSDQQRCLRQNESPSRTTNTGRGLPLIRRPPASPSRQRAVARRSNGAVARLRTHRRRVNAKAPRATGARIVQHNRATVQVGVADAAGTSGCARGITVVCRGRRSSNCGGNGREGICELIGCRILRGRASHRRTPLDRSRRSNRRPARGRARSSDSLRPSRPEMPDAIRRRQWRRGWTHDAPTQSTKRSP